MGTGFSSGWLDVPRMLHQPLLHACWAALPRHAPMQALTTCPPAVCVPQADRLLSLYHGEWRESVDPIYSPDFTY